jgi:hypothetical protein
MVARRILSVRLPFLFLVASTLVAPATSFAELPPVDVGARLGYAASFGDAASGVPMKALAIQSQVPVQVEALVRVWRDLAVGPYAAYGFGQVDGAALAGACEIAGVSCSGHAWRAGAEARWTFASLEAPLVPWVGAALGWEWSSVQGKDATGSSTVSVNGLEAGLQAGGDFAVARRVRVGPYMMVGLGRYGRGETTAGGSPVGEQATHGWLGLGVAGRFDVAP